MLVKYLESCVLLVWYIDPETRSAKSCTSPGDVIEIPVEGMLSGEDVPSGFQSLLASLFNEADRSR